MADVAAPIPDELDGGEIKWGAQFDCQRLTGRKGEKHAPDPGKYAGYLAKYATKSTETAGGSLHRVTKGHVEHVKVSEHVRDYMRAAFKLEAKAEDRRLGHNAHQFGYRGHCLTKSRRYSTTFTQLRQDRAEFVRRQILERALARDAGQHKLAEIDFTERQSHFKFSAAGGFTAVEAYIAAKGAADRQEQRQMAREARREELAVG